jgi:hypothetical protein
VRLFFVFAAAVLAYKIPVVGRALSLEAVAGLLSAVALTVLWLALRVRTVAGIAALFVVGGLVFAHFLPGQASAQHLSHWAPLRGPIDHVVLGLASALEILWPPAALGYLSRIASPPEHHRAVAWGGAALLAILLAALDWQTRSVPYVTILLMAGTWTLFGLLFLEHPAQQAVRPSTPTRQISSRRARISAAMLACALLPAMLVDEARATTLRVGPQHALKAPSAAAKVARDGDRIEIEAGVYAGDAAVWRQSGLTLRGIGGRAHLQADGAQAEGKGIWVIKGNDTIVENIEFSRAKVPDRNGAGIRLEGRNLTVRNCYFHDNENGILAGSNGASDVFIEHSEFARNGAGDGQSHNLYIGTVRTFTLRESYVHHAMVGHNVKSRALKNVIENNRIMDEADGRASYAIDLPDGGISFVVGNVLQQGPKSENSTILAYAAEKYRNPANRLFVLNNTFFNGNPAGGRFLSIRTGADSIVVMNNVFSGPGALPSGVLDAGGNLRVRHSDFVDPDRFDFRLKTRSAAAPPSERAAQ